MEANSSVDSPFPYGYHHLIGRIMAAADEEEQQQPEVDGDRDGDYSSMSSSIELKIGLWAPRVTGVIGLLCTLYYPLYAGHGLE